ncbi:hypothetical protein IAG44_20635 [Streptomyces roseirectus]|uniref:Secreted protein n=1 Tax=Streptomyces roseirectus TaxID=2768066 RepID=A0A7H0IFN2_9ACTN|nr:DUF6344 domain-containing protein [Streptomyces roseirectus]QNP71598.1 hypothetical protein IAG44_20635 [Streptomyces roseirectus]
MARTQLKNLWTTVITALLALCATLGLITTSAAPAAAQPTTPRNTTATTTPHTEPPAWDWTRLRSVPPTMKQRIRAEAHGSSPHCRHLPRTNADAATPDCPATPDTPLQR